ncbi:MAG: hypothetical protein LH472_12225 [Pyrinomonadaceae bacterium]|nr:hypothetical protein [Pyrinomonadaceae bacterium]
MKSDNPKIIFVYNADSGVFNLLTDVAHKMFSPQTYACNLCAVTHSNFGMKKEWKEFLETLENPLEFLHADEFKSRYKFEEVELPAIFKLENGALNLMVAAAAINKCQSIEDLKRKII